MGKTWSTPGHAITKEQHDALCEGRDRPLTQTPIRNSLASESRAMAAMVDDRADHDGLEALIADRQRRRTADTVIGVPGGGGHKQRGICGTNSGYNSHTRRREPPCDPCRNAHNEYGRNLNKKAP